MNDHEKLKESNDLLENVITSLPLSVAVVSTHLQLIKANEAFLYLFELGNDIPVNESLGDIENDFWKPDVLSFFAEQYRTEEYDFEREFNWEGFGGRLRNIQIKSQLMQITASNTPQILLTCYDVTPQRQTEKERNDRIRFLMHELRNPLSNISLCVELLADSTKENNQEETEMFLSKAANSVQRMKQVINDLGTFRQATTQ
jgi:signal transduction histidine kinase